MNSNSARAAFLCIRALTQLDGRVSGRLLIEEGAEQAGAEHLIAYLDAAGKPVRCVVTRSGECHQVVCEPLPEDETWLRNKRLESISSNSGFFGEALRACQETSQQHLPVVYDDERVYLNSEELKHFYAEYYFVPPVDFVLSQDTTDGAVEKGLYLEPSRSVEL